MFLGKFSFMKSPVNKKSKEILKILDSMIENKELEKKFLELLQEEDFYLIISLVNILYEEYLTSSSTKNRDMCYILEILYQISLSLLTKFKGYFTSNKSVNKLFLLIFLEATKHHLKGATESLIEYVKLFSCRLLPKIYILSSLQFLQIEEATAIQSAIEDIYQEKEKEKSFSVELFEKLCFSTAEKDTIGLFPTHLKRTGLSKLIEISEDGYTAEYVGNNEICQSIISDSPISRTQAVYYFEVQIINSSDFISIGLVDKYFNAENQVPGWEVNSIGFYSDDGSLSLGNKHEGIKYGRKFITKDYVGCYIDRINNIFFFTINGQIIEKKTLNENFIDIELYPAIGLSRENQKVKVNFGQWKFLFGLEKYKLEQTYKKFNCNTVEGCFKDIDEKKADYMILDYLLYNGYESTFNEFSKNIADDKSKYFNNMKISERSKFIPMIERRKFDKLKRIIEKNFPSPQKVEVILSFYDKIICAFDELVENKIGLNTFFLGIKEMLSDRIFRDTCGSIFKSELEELFSFLVYQKEEAIQKISQFLSTTLNSERIFIEINSLLLGDNYSVHGCELEIIVKQIIQCSKEFNNCIQSNIV